jgi:hypothetical protein
MAAIEATLRVEAGQQQLIYRGKKVTAADTIRDGAKLMLLGSAAGAQRPTPQQNIGGRLSLNAESLDQPPHSGIIAKGPPAGCIRSFRTSLFCLPKEPLVLYNKTGAIVKVSFESDAIWIQADAQQDRVFFNEIKNHLTQDIRGTGYFVLAFITQSEKYWFYFLPFQYIDTIGKLLRAAR